MVFGISLPTAATPYRSAAARPAQRWVSAEDFTTAARMTVGLGLLALPFALRERLLALVARHRTRSKAGPRFRNVARMTALLADETARDPRALLFRWHEHHLAYELLVLRTALGGKPDFPYLLRGNEHLHAALARGRGVVLWGMPFLYVPLVPGIALWREGLASVALSRWTHGYARTRLGAALLNPIRVRAENRFLLDRVVIGRNCSPLPALRRLLDELRHNRPVSILLAPLAERLLDVPFAGGRLRVPSGPLRLAARARCPVLPVCCWWEDGRFVVEIDEPLPALADGDRGTQAAAELARRLEIRVRRVPDQFHWPNPSFVPPHLAVAATGRTQGRGGPQPSS